MPDIITNNIWNTGVFEPGHLRKNGETDLYWWVVGGPGIITPQPAYVLNDQRSINVGGPYWETTDSKWIWVTADAMDNPTTPNATYVFETKFYLDIVGSQWIRIVGKWCVDNFGNITIDGATLSPASSSGQTSLPAGEVGANHSALHDFTITGAHVPSTSQLPIKAGYHSLRVSVQNEGPPDPGNPAGFNVSALQVLIHEGIPKPPIRFPV